MSLSKDTPGVKELEEIVRDQVNHVNRESMPD
jgi:hypothetical protein